MDFKQRRWTAPGEMRVFSKWVKTRKGYGSNVGLPVKHAMEWLALQGVEPPEDCSFDTNGGRTALAAWLDETHAPYHEGFEIHGDLFEVWSEHYQPGLASSSFARRTQSPDPRTATAALRRLAVYFGRDRRAVVQNLDLSAQLMVGFLNSQGQALLAQNIVQRYQQHQH